MKSYPPKRELHLAQPPAAASKPTASKINQSPGPIRQVLLSSSKSTSASDTVRSTARQSSAEQAATAISTHQARSDHPQRELAGQRTPSGPDLADSFGAAFRKRGAGNIPPLPGMSRTTKEKITSATPTLTLKLSSGGPARAAPPGPASPNSDPNALLERPVAQPSRPSRVATPCPPLETVAPFQHSAAFPPPLAVAHLASAALAAPNLAAVETGQALPRRPEGVPMALPSPGQEVRKPQTKIILKTGTAGAATELPVAPRRPAAKATELIDEATLSALTGIAQSTLRNWRCQGRGPRFIRVSRRCVRYARDEVDAWIAARTVRSTSDRDAADA